MYTTRLAIALCGTTLLLGACASDEPAPAVEQPVDPVEVVPYFEVTARRLNVRYEPSLSGAVIGTLKRGERVAAPYGSVAGWMYVETDSTLAGYVSDEYLAAIEAEPVAPAPPPAPAATTETAPEPSAQPAGAAEPDYTPAPGSPLSQVHEGMTVEQVTDILGPPTGEHNYITGKSFIPYYYGPDTSRMDFKYAGLGRVVFSRNRYSSGLKVIRVEADPSETGH